MGPEEAKKERLAVARKRVIVIDDNEILLRAWRKILSRQDCEPFLTTNPQEALSLLKGDEQDVLIVDVVMPQMDGFELIQKAQEISPRVRIIMTTGYSCDFKKIRLQVDTPDIHVLMKPYSNISAIENFLGRVIRNDESLDTEDSFKNPDDIRIHLWNL